MNPYLDAFDALKSGPSDLFEAMRKKLIWPYSWAVPNAAAIAELKAHSPILELGAGTGYWAWLAKMSGVDILPFDLEATQPPQWVQINASIDPSNQETIDRYPERTLFLCWPSYQNPMAFNALNHFKGSTVIYVGEFNGRTADAEFHAKLTESFSLKKEVSIPQWPGFHDKLYVFERRA